MKNTCTIKLKQILFGLNCVLLSDHSFLSGFFGVRSAPSENLSPTSIKNNEKSNKNQLPAEDSDKLKNDKTKDKSKKDDKLKLPDLQANPKSPETSFGSMDFDQNDLRRSTPNAEEIESAPKTTNPLMMNFIKNSTEQIGNQKNLEAIREETPEGKNKTPKVPKGVKETKENKETKAEPEEIKDSTKKEKKEKKEKKKEKKNEEAALKEDVFKNQEDAHSLEGDSNLFSMEPLSERKDDETEKKKSKKGGKGKNKSKE